MQTKETNKPNNTITQTNKVQTQHTTANNPKPINKLPRTKRKSSNNITPKHPNSLTTTK